MFLLKKLTRSPNDDKRMLSIDSTETYEYGTNFVNDKEEIKCNNIIKLYKE